MKSVKSNKSKNRQMLDYIYAYATGQEFLSVLIHDIPTSYVSILESYYDNPMNRLTNVEFVILKRLIAKHDKRNIQK